MKTQNMETIGGRLRSLRMGLGLTQQKLSEEFGLKNSLLSMYESGKRYVPVDVIESFSNKLNVTTDWIIKGKVSDIETQSDYEEILFIYNGLRDDKIREVALR